MRPALDDYAASLGAVVRPVPAAVPDDPALVRPLRPVINSRRAPIAASPAAPQFGVELLQQERRDPPDRDVTQCGPDVPAGVPLIAAQRALIRLVDPQTGVQGRAQRGAGLDVPALLDLGDHPS